MPNRLIHESSPYLQQHAHNPVDWYPWGEEALERARQEKRMIFLSIGYASCHWCHVMEHESFEDPDTAALLNKHFVNIKVDREERPDVDAVYMEALQLMTGQGGWPLNIWLTPEQTPVFAGTYFPPKDIHGRPAFTTVIRRLADVYRNNPDKVEEQAAEMRKALNQDLYDRLPSAAVTTRQLDKAYEAYSESYDENDGGFSEPPKFPMAMGIGFLLRYGHKPGSRQTEIPGDHQNPYTSHDAGSSHHHESSHVDNSRYGAHEMALNSLEKMIHGGIYDHVGGGFHRYSTDKQWLVPHFEKMLYDNALLIPAMAEAAQISQKPVFKDTALETIDFLNREMRHPDGAYYAALDADTDGVEGKFYTFTFEEIQSILEPDLFSLFADRYGVKQGGNWEGASILHQSATLQDLAEKHQYDDKTIRLKLHEAKSRLLEYREQRTRPGLDNKIITSWNALMLHALCQATKLLDRTSGEALQLGDFLAENTLHNDTLYRIIDNSGNAKQPGFLDDYALLADGFSQLFEITGDPAWLQHAVRLADLIIKNFYDEEKAAFHYTSMNQGSLIAGTRDVFDNAQPGGTSAAIKALYRIGQLAGRPEWVQTAVNAMKPLSETAASHAQAFGNLLQIMHHHCYPGNEIVIVSKSGTTPSTDPVARDMIKTWQQHYDPSSYLVRISEGQSFADTGFETLYNDKIALNGATTAYICRDFQCQKPVQTPDTFRDMILSAL